MMISSLLVIVEADLKVRLYGSGRAVEGRAASGSANTSIEFPLAGRLISGVSSIGICDVQLPPPKPAGTAMYCRPRTEYVIGNP
jgi:hypothetical protein